MLIKPQYTVLEILLAYWFLNLVTRVAKCDEIHVIEMIFLLALTMVCTFVILNVVYTIFSHLMKVLKVKR